MPLPDFDDIHEYAIENFKEAYEFLPSVDEIQIETVLEDELRALRTDTGGDFVMTRVVVGLKRACDDIGQKEVSIIACIWGEDQLGLEPYVEDEGEIQDLSQVRLFEPF